MRRWQRHGHDRLYISRPGGPQIGWVDLLSGAAQTVDPANFTRSSSAAATYCAHHDLGTWRPPGTAWSTGRPVDSTPSPSTAAAPRMSHRGTTWPEPGWPGRPGGGPDRACGQSRGPGRSSVVVRILDRKTPERAWRVGADGEESVGAKLDGLSEHGWHVLHAVPVGDRGTDIDHVLIGPGGVLTLNTKNHPGATVWRPAVQS